MTLTAPSLFRSLSFSTDLAEKLPDWISGKHIRNGAQEVHGVHGFTGVRGVQGSREKMPVVPVALFTRCLQTPHCLFILNKEKFYLDDTKN